MHHRHLAMLLGAGVLGALLGACDGATAVQADAGPLDVTPPTVGLYLGRYDLVAGPHSLTMLATDDVAVVRAELWIDGIKVGESAQEPFTIDWDSTAVADGVRQVQVSAYDAAGNRGDSETVPIFVVNTGSTVVFQEAPELLEGFLEDTFAVPANWNGNSELIDLKYHWTMPAGMTRATAVLLWDQAAGFDLVFSLGTGWCPDSGVLLEELVENDGEVVLEHAPGAALEAVDWFVHVGAANAADLQGQSVPFRLRVVLFP